MNLGKNQPFRQVEEAKYHLDALPIGVITKNKGDKSLIDGTKRERPTTKPCSIGIEAGKGVLHVVCCNMFQIVGGSADRRLSAVSAG